MSIQVTYRDIISHAKDLGVQFISWNNCKYDKDKNLGFGASMKVFSGSYDVNGVSQPAAFKFVMGLTKKATEKRRSEILRDVKQEIRILGRLKGHPHIVQLFCVSFDGHTPVLILELAKSNLENYLQEGERVEWKIKRKFMYDIALGLEAIHKAKWVHGDLKGSNILIYELDNEQIVAKISDFGYSSTDLSVQEGRTPGYTKYFCSRECFDPKLKDWNGKPTTDLYSYGLVAYQIADDGTIPFEDYEHSEISDKKEEGTELQVLMDLLPKDTPMEIQKIIKATVKNVPSERLGLNEIKDILNESTEGNQVHNNKTTGMASRSSYIQVTYHDLISHISNLMIPFIPWSHCKRGQIIGGSAYMNMFSGVYEINGVIRNVAFKLPNGSLTEKSRESRRNILLKDFMQETRIMGYLKGHSNIVQILGISFDDHMPVLVLEPAKSNLKNYLQDGERVEWKIKLRFMYDIILGVEAIHKAEIVHGDLKATNILIYDIDNDQTVAKISNFGFSSTNLSVQQGRTPGYTPIFRSRETFDPELKDWNGKPTTDLYSYGLLTYQIAHDGIVPFEDYDEEEIDDMKKEGSELEVLMEGLPNDTPMEVRKIIKAIVRNVPSERSSIDEVKKMLKESEEWDQVYSYEDTKTVFSSLTPIKSQGPIKISKMNELSIPPLLKKTIFREYQRLADAGDMVSFSRLGSCWNLGFGTEHDSFKAFECYTKAAEAGDATAQFNLGACYAHGNGVPQDYIKAVEFYTKAAEASNADALFNLGFCYENGTGVPQDYLKAVELYAKAVEAGNADAQNYTKGHTKAIELYTKAAETGDANAQNKLGLCYYNGEGVPQDYIKAVELYTKAAEAGNAMAQYNLGLCYYNGEGVPQDYIKAVELYRKAAEAGNGYALNNLGLCYENGFGVTKDYIKAIELYLKSKTQEY